MKDRDLGRVTRRELGRVGIGLALAVCGASIGVRPVRAEDAALVDELPENAALIKAISYVNQSAVAGANCGNCALYLGGAAPKGRCGLFQRGVVPVTGHCVSWIKKSA
jgi:High potential iron-sulfur protein